MSHDSADRSPPIFELFRGNHGTELLTAAVAGTSTSSAGWPRTGRWNGRRGEIVSGWRRGRSGAVHRPAGVRAAGGRRPGADRPDAPGPRAPVPGGPFDVGGYIGLAAESPGVLEMVERLRTNRPAGAEEDEGAAFIYREGIESAMEHEATARQLTLALAGRARNVAPVLAGRLPARRRAGRCSTSAAGPASTASPGSSGTRRSARSSGTGPRCSRWPPRWPRPTAWPTASKCRARRHVPRPRARGADVVLLSNVLHDWDVPRMPGTGRPAAPARCPPGGRLLIHDVFLNDALDGPLPIALYSAALFRLTEGRAYSAARISGLAGRGRPPPAVDRPHSRALRALAGREEAGRLRPRPVQAGCRRRGPIPGSGLRGAAAGPLMEEGLASVPGKPL